MSQVYIEPGYNEPTRVYRVKLVEIATIEPGNTLSSIIDSLKFNGVDSVLINPAYPKEADQMLADGLQVQKVRLHRDTPREA